jgi:hypothetical protein
MRTNHQIRSEHLYESLRHLEDGSGTALDEDALTSPHQEPGMGTGTDTIIGLRDYATSAGAVTNGRMEAPTALEQPNEVAMITRKKTRQRRPLPPQDSRDWLTPEETALALGCSVATVHRLRRGLIAGIDALPCSQYGRKFVFRKASVSRWQDNNEKRGLA